jgi:hypothetical protein
MLPLVQLAGLVDQPRPWDDAVVAEMGQRVDDFLFAGVVGGPSTELAPRGLPDQAAALELIEDEPAGGGELSSRLMLEQDPEEPAAACGRPRSWVGIDGDRRAQPSPSSSSSSTTVRLRAFRAANSVDALAKSLMARDAISSYRLGLTGVGLTGQRIKIVCGMSLVSMSSTVSLVAGVMWPSLRVMGEDWFTADLCSVEVPVCALTREPGPLMVSPPRSCTQPARDGNAKRS